MIEWFEKVKIRYLFFLYPLMFIIVAMIEGILSLYNIHTQEFTTIIIRGSVLITILLMIRYNGHRLNLDFSIFKRKKVAVEVVTLTVVKLVFALGLVLILVRIIYFLEPINQDAILSETPLGDNIAANFIASIIIAPIFEEVLFRGVIFARVSKRFGVMTGIIISSILFGIVHVKLSIIKAFISGVIACILFKKYNNILLCIAMHFLNNLIPTLIPFGDSEISFQPSSGELNEMLIYGLILFIPSLIFLVKYLMDNLKVIRNQDNNVVTELA